MRKTCLLTAMLACALMAPGMALGATHYIAANGSDSNNGTAETTPWLHAPGMPSCTANCASYTPAPGDSIIFRGGDTWHFGNSSASSYTGGTWTWTWSGSSSSFIYIGVDQTWFTGASWTRPILNGDNPTGTTVASCSHVPPSGDQVYLSGVRYVTFDNFEFTGMCWDGSVGNQNYLHYAGAVSGYQNPMNIQNNYLHGWTHTLAGTQGGGSGFSGYNQNFGATLQFNVVDGSDSDDLSLQWCGQGADTYILADNIIRHVGGTCVSDTCHIVHDNVIEYINNVTDGSSHTDALFCFGEAGEPQGDGTPNIFYNNVFRYIGTEYNSPISYPFTGAPPAGKTDYFFNNVFHDLITGGTNYVVWCDGGSCNSGASIVMSNNTFEAPLPDFTAGCIICNSPNVKITAVNNHWISNNGTGLSTVFANTGQVTETAGIYQTFTVATGQGYNSIDDFAPTASSNASVGAGANESSAVCNAMQSAGAPASAVSACESGTTDGCAYDSSNHTVSCPAIAVVSRPSSGAWDAGAYQFSAQLSRPAAPTNLKAVVNN
jgi:hypothetical protein